MCIPIAEGLTFAVAALWLFTLYLIALRSFQPAQLLILPLASALSIIQNRLYLLIDTTRI